MTGPVRRRRLAAQQRKAQRRMQRRGFVYEAESLRLLETRLDEQITHTLERSRQERFSDDQEHDKALRAASDDVIALLDCLESRVSEDSVLDEELTAGICSELGWSRERLDDTAALACWLIQDFSRHKGARQ